MAGKPSGLGFGIGMMLKGLYLLEVENELSQFVDAEFGNIIGVSPGF